MNAELATALARVLPFALVIAVVALRIRLGRLPAASLDLQVPSNWRVALLWWGGFVAYLLTVEAVLFRAGLLEFGTFHHQGLAAALRILGMVLLAPVAEELLFRGLLLNLLQRATGGFWRAALIQAALFTVLHNFAWRGDLLGGFYAAQGFLDALIYAGARRGSGSLLTPMILHATGNTVAVLEMLP